MDQLQDFINKLNGQKGIGDTEANKGECVGLIDVWLDDTLKLPHVWGNAMDLLINAEKGSYTIEYNSDTAIPPRGAVLVFKKAFNGTFGHTGIVTKADVKTFELFEQNNPLGGGCRLHAYPNYAYVDGWIIPKAQDTQAVIDELRKARDENWNKYQTEVSVNNDLTKQLQDEQKRSQDLRGILDKQTEVDAELGNEQRAAQHKTNEYKGFLDSISKLLDLPTPQDYTGVDLVAIEKKIEALQAPVEEQLKPLQNQAIVLNNQMPSLEKKRTSKKDKNLILQLRDFFLRIIKKT